MNYQKKSKEELIKELKQLRQECLELKTLSEKDISLYNPKENYLIERCKMFQDAQKLAHIGIWEWEKESDHVIWSDELFCIAALDSRFPAPTYADHAKLYTPQSWQLLNTAIKNALKTGESYQLELEMIRPDGTIRNVSIYGGAKYNASHDKVIGLFGLIMDVTERKRSENALLRSEERNRLLSTVTMEGILIHRNGIAIDLNQSLTKMLGYEYDELLHKDFIEIVHVDDRQMVRENIGKEYAHPYQVKAMKKNGELFTIEIESKNFLYQEEQWRVSAIRDITVRIQTEELQRTMVEMLNIAPSSITVHDTDGRFLYANQKTFELHGYTESEFMAINLHALDVPESEALLSERFRRISESGFASFEVAHYHKDGHTFPLEVYAKTVEWRGQSAVLSIATDITERKQAEEEIKKAKDKAEESDRLKSAFLANMSHEIRTPMNGILGFAELLKEPNLSGDEQKEYIRIIEKSGARMLNTLNEIVDISKIEAGLIEMDIREVNLNELMDFAFQFFIPEVEAKGIILSCQRNLPDQEVLIKTDKEKLYAILFNLIKNAIKYTKTGSIGFGYSVTTSTVPGKFIEQEELEFFVKDTGIGIPTNRQKAIFERFIQADVLDKMLIREPVLDYLFRKPMLKCWVDESGWKAKRERVRPFILPSLTIPARKETTFHQSKI